MNDCKPMNGTKWWTSEKGGNAGLAQRRKQIEFQNLQAEATEETWRAN